MNTVVATSVLHLYSTTFSRQCSFPLGLGR